MENAVKILHNPKCRKSREALAWLLKQNYKVEIIDYMKEGITVSFLQEILSLLDLGPFEIVRKGEDVYKEFVKGKNLDDNSLVEMMCKNPKLIERPIVLVEDRAILARPLENLMNAI